MTELLYEEIDADKSLTDFVKRFWKFSNPTADKRNYTILPDGYFGECSIKCGTPFMNS